MGKIICYCGMPGSGKTFVAKSSKEYLNEGYILIDDPSLDFKISEMDVNKNYIICDPHLCRPSTRKAAIDLFRDMGFEVKFIYFENDIEKCKNNIKYRTGKGDDRQILNLKVFGYQVPFGEPTLEIWQNEICYKE